MEKVYVFQCPECMKIIRRDEPTEPCCTGPSESRHDHDLAVMMLTTIEAKKVSHIGICVPSKYAAVRAEGPMVFPDTDRSIVAAVKRRNLILAE